MLLVPCTTSKGVIECKRSLWGTGKSHTWVSAVANKAHGRVGGVKHCQSSTLDGERQHTREPCAA